MQHVFEFLIKPKEGTDDVHLFYNTESSRNSKVAKKILAEINELREKSELAPWAKEDIAEFRLKKIR